MGKGVKATRKAGIIADMEALMPGPELVKKHGKNGQPLSGMLLYDSLSTFIPRGMKKYEDLTQRNREAEMKDFDKPSGYEIRQVWVSARASIG